MLERASRSSGSRTALEGVRNEPEVPAPPQAPASLPFHVLGDHSEGVARPHVADGVAALVGGAAERVGGAGAPLVVGKGGVRLQGVTATTEAGTKAGLLL